VTKVTSSPRVAVCHEWVTTYGGSEQVAQRLVSALDASDVFTFTARPELAEALFPGRRVHVSPLGRTAMARDHWHRLLPLMPRAWAAFDLRGFDAVVTSSHACANAIRVPDGTVHISYTHTPMRYAWKWREELDRLPAALRPAWPPIAAALRRQDANRARRVDTFVANSEHVAGRIRESYGRDAEVVHPPVDVSWWTPPTEEPERAAFLVAGRLVAYKRIATAIEAARLAHVPLVVAGAGPQLEPLRRMAAGADIRFVVGPSRDHLRALYRSSRALVVPGVEDFGMTMIEAQACGTPVIARGTGGACEAVIDDETGWLTSDGSAVTLASALLRFDGTTFDPARIRAHAERFRVERFDAEIREVVDRALSRTGAATRSGR
jgi:glycosyltransferase involved in cell wall biosynthesis